VAGLFFIHEIKDVSVSTTTIFAQSALFSNTTDNQIKTTNTIDGLSGQTISSLYYSADKTLVGYENGLIVVINKLMAPC
jgi:hypothetical protein